MANRRTQKLAFVISRLFGPLPLICLLWLVVAIKSGIGFWRAIWVYPLIFIVTIATPFAVTTYLIYKKRVKDIEWSDINDRKKYLLPIILVSFTILNLLVYFLVNSVIFHLTLVFSVIVGAMIVIWVLFNFKISGHMIIATTTFSAINLFFHLKFLWLFVLLIPIIWARKILKMHTLAQLLAGIILPVAISLLAIFLFGWPNI